MNYLKHIFFLVAFLLLTAGSSAQPSTEEQLAIQFYQNKEFDKALDYYENLYNKKSSQLYYTPYLNCLVETKEFKKAEKIVKKQIKHNPEQLSFQADLGMLYLKSTEPEKAKKTWEQAVKQIQTDDQTLNLANAFNALLQYDYSILSYLRGRKISPSNYPYNFELAEIYKTKGDKLAMINELLDALEISDSYIQSVQNALQTSFNNESDNKQNEVVKTELLKRISKHPDKTIFSELLIWMQLQQKDWEGAFVQAKALDKRKKEEGNRMMGLAQLFAENQAYDVAIKAYQFVIAKGPEAYFYSNARTELLTVSYQKITSNRSSSTNELLELEKNYALTIRELGKSASTATLLRNYAHLQAFYLNKAEDAILLLEETIAFPQLTNTIQAECKLELADILLMTGSTWDASLLYSQVEKANKYDVMGQEAKFRNARIYYYTGDFAWAQAQLDVLKGSTSKLISNDAMNLSMLISDALAIDTNEVPLEMYAMADLLAFRNKDDLAIKLLDSINKTFPNHALADDILYKKAQLELKHSNYTKAILYLNDILNNYGKDILADDALFKLAELQEQQLQNTEKAKELYRQLIEAYPDSLYVVEARKRFRKLRGDTIN